MEGAQVHPSAVCDEGCSIGQGTRVWHFSHVMAGARIGRDCVIGQNCFIADGVTIGDRVRIQNNVSVYQGVILEDEVFCGPSVVFSNVVRPRAAYPSKPNYEVTRVRKGATLGANATIVAGAVLGEHCFVAAGAVVRSNVAAFELVAGVPARHLGWVSVRGESLTFDSRGAARCPIGGDRYLLRDGELIQVD
ncbi:MAG TPA: acyltransferase [Polyangiaceae bacterium]|jgi:UDP-2-acetamido-3-amino-2,3-dideoxy-glucuronate N-acetyltransferase|nr:acyltransferase [Polyangiaceae bacterium]